MGAPNAAADGLFPDTEPFAEHRIPVGDCHVLHVEECGNPDGLPLLFLHGGPGSGCQPRQRRLFDPQRFRAILVDQRGCGRSTPLGRLAGNDTTTLVEDFERVREALGIERWLLCGGSWGSLLALAYAAEHPGRILGLVLRGIFLGSREEVGAYLRGAHHAAAVAGDSGDDLLAPWRQAILGDDRVLARRAARDWLDHERALMGEAPLAGPPDATQIAKARLQIHYLAHQCFLAPGQLLNGIERFRHLPAAIVQGLADPVCPPLAAARLHAAWPEAYWIGVVGAGHGGLTPPLAAATVAALARVADRVEHAPSPSRLPYAQKSPPSALPPSRGELEGGGEQRPANDPIPLPASPLSQGIPSLRDIKGEESSCCRALAKIARPESRNDGCRCAAGASRSGR